MVFAATLLDGFGDDVVSKEGDMIGEQRTKAPDMDRITPGLRIMGSVKGQEMYTKLSGQERT